MFSSLPNVYAEKLTEIRENGSLVFDSGKHCAFAGLNLTHEANSMLASLLSGKEISIEEEILLEDLALGGTHRPIPSYLFVETESVSLPFDPVEEHIHQRVMINEMLIKVGAATVNDERNFKHLQAFLALQEQAKNEGQGIWSYEEYYEPGESDLDPQNINQDFAEGDMLKMVQ